MALILFALVMAITLLDIFHFVLSIFVCWPNEINTASTETEKIEGERALVGENTHENEMPLRGREKWAGNGCGRSRR